MAPLMPGLGPGPARAAGGPRPTQYERDLATHGQAGAKVLGAARAVADVVAADCSFSPGGLARLAAERDAAPPAAQMARTTAGAAGSALAGAGTALAEAADAVARVGASAAGQAAAAYAAIGDLADSASKGAARAEQVVSDAAAQLGDGLSTVADNVAGHALRVIGLTR